MGGVDHQVSVSFGEKWCNNNNKYLEEVGKCSTPGSVAQKKAFFEAHYKKIAAMKKKLAEAQNEDEEEPPVEVEVEVEVEVDDKPPFNSTATEKLEEAALVNAESMKLVQDHFQLKMEYPKKEEKKKKAAEAEEEASKKESYSTRRRSLFMEQMGDKDIVKRVFKALLPKQPLPTNSNTPVTYHKQINQRSRKAVADKLVNHPQLGATVRKSGDR